MYGAGASGNGGSVVVGPVVDGEAVPCVGDAVVVGVGDGVAGLVVVVVVTAEVVVVVIGAAVETGGRVVGAFGTIVLQAESTG